MAGPITAVFDLAEDLLECAQQGLIDNDLEEPCRVCVVPGEIVWDTCANGGQLVISSPRVYYSNVFPTELAQDSTIPSNCGPGVVVGEYTLSLMRCAPLPKGNPPKGPSCAELRASALQINQDGFALRTSLLCCLAAMRRQNIILEYRLSGSTVIGPEGGCVGNEITILVGLQNG